MNHVLIVDDEAEIRESLEEILERGDYLVTTTATATEAMVLLRDAAYEWCCWISGCRTGMGWIRWWRSGRWHENSPEVVIISGHGTIESAVRATKLGAYDFLEKPLCLDRTLMVLKNAMQARQMRRKTASLCGSLRRRDGDRAERADEGAAAADQADGADQRAGADLRRGTGKELIGRAMHAESLRKDRVFVELNCAAIPEDYIETELFGYRHGAGPQ